MRFIAGADGPCGNYDATEDYFVTVVGEQRNKLAVYESAHPPTPADSAAGQCCGGVALSCCDVIGCDD